MSALKVYRRVLKALDREHRRGPMCEPCHDCAACKGVESAIRVLEQAIIEATEAPRHEADRLHAEGLLRRRMAAVRS